MITFAPIAHLSAPLWSLTKGCTVVVDPSLNRSGMFFCFVCCVSSMSLRPASAASSPAPTKQTQGLSQVPTLAAIMTSCLLPLNWIRKTSASRSVLASDLTWRNSKTRKYRLRKRIVWTLTLTLLTLTLLAVRSCILKALAVAVLSLSDVRTTKRSCCLVAARGRREILLKIETVYRCIAICVLSNSAVSARPSQNIVNFSWLLLFLFLSSGTCLLLIELSTYKNHVAYYST